MHVYPKENKLGWGMHDAHRSLRIVFINASKCTCIIEIGLNALFHGFAAS